MLDGEFEVLPILLGKGILNFAYKHHKQIWLISVETTFAVSARFMLVETVIAVPLRCDCNHKF